LLLCLLLLSACKHPKRAQETAYVSAPQVFLRDRVAAVYNKTGFVRNGEKVDVLDHDRRFVQVRKADGTIGWIEQRYLITQAVFDSFQKLLRENQDDPPQATGTTRNDTNIHLDPSRDADHLYQLASGTIVTILKRASSEKKISAPPRPSNPGSEPPRPSMEDWWLIRSPEGHVGWVLARLVDMNVPLEIAQYAEGQRIVAFFPLNEVSDGDKKVPQYLLAFSDPREGSSFDFNQIRVFTWNVRRHRYETAYREHTLDGVLPITVGQENFEKEGMLPTFTIREEDEKGAVSERKYKLNTPIVRRVLAPGQQPAHRSSMRTKGKKKSR
jgi:hypothetical protein